MRLSFFALGPFKYYLQKRLLTILGGGGSMALALEEMEC